MKLYFSDGADINVSKANVIKDFQYFLIIDFTVLIGIVLIKKLVEVGKVWGRTGFHDQRLIKDIIISQRIVKINA